MKKALLLYLPVIHSGYLKFLKGHTDAHTIFLVGENLIKELSMLYPEEISLRSLVRDPRCLDSVSTTLFLQQIFPQTKICVLDQKGIQNLAEYDMVVMPDEQICTFLHFAYPEIFDNGKVKYESTFLRWDMPKAIAQMTVLSDYEITLMDLTQMGLISVHDKAFQEAQKSSDWWRQVGCVLVKKGEILLVGYNKHLPSEYENDIKGDPRSNFNAGEYIEFSSAIHAEAGVIGTAASLGICTKGLEIFVTTFPCPACAALVATSGISRMFFVDGYSNVNALSVLREYGVEIVRVID